MPRKFAKELRKTRFLFLLIDQSEKIDWEQVDEAITQAKPVIVAFIEKTFDPIPHLLALLRRKAIIHSTLYMVNFERDIVAIIKQNKQIFEIPLPKINYLNID